MNSLRDRIGAAALLLFAVTIGSAQKPEVILTMDQVMTGQELNETGVSTLNPVQRRALDRWLNRYTEQIIRLTETPRASVSQSCSPAIETQIDGDFEGWEGETIFRLMNGQIWEQAEYSYTYSYAYMPEVVIYQARDGCRMKVEGVDETIRVRRVK